MSEDVGGIRCPQVFYAKQKLESMVAGLIQLKSELGRKRNRFLRLRLVLLWFKIIFVKG